MQIHDSVIHMFIDASSPFLRDTTPAKHRVPDADACIAYCFNELTGENISPDDLMIFDEEMKELSNQTPLTVIAKNPIDNPMEEYTSFKAQYLGVEVGERGIEYKFDNIEKGPFRVNAKDIIAITPLDIRNADFETPDDVISQLNLVSRYDEYLEFDDIPRLADKFTDAIDNLDAEVNIVVNAQRSYLQQEGVPLSETRRDYADEDMIYGRLIGVIAAIEDGENSHDMFAVVTNHGGANHIIPLVDGTTVFGPDALQ